MDLGKHFEDFPLLKVLFDSIGEGISRLGGAAAKAGNMLGDALDGAVASAGNLGASKGGDESHSAPAVQGEKLGRSASIHNNKGAGELLARGEFDVDFNDVTVPNVGTAYKASSQGAMVG